LSGPFRQQLCPQHWAASQSNSASQTRGGFSPTFRISKEPRAVDPGTGFFPARILDSFSSACGSLHGFTVSFPVGASNWRPQHTQRQSYNLKGRDEMEPPVFHGSRRVPFFQDLKIG